MDGKAITATSALNILVVCTATAQSRGTVCVMRAGVDSYAIKV